jgi:hypothetical protein
MIEEKSRHQVDSTELTVLGLEKNPNVIRMKQNERINATEECKCRPVNEK